MITPRVIPILLLNEGGLVKTKNFKNPRYIGDPINAVRIFNEKEVDELIIFDIQASKTNRPISFEFLKDIVSESFMPLGYGGGINTLDQIKRLFDIGIEKIILNTNSINFGLIHKASLIYGNQSIVVNIDVRKNIFGKYTAYIRSGREKLNLSPIDLAKKVTESGAGEIIIQSIDKEGTMNGYDLEIIKKVSQIVDVPVVASGGAGNLKHFQDAINYGASAVAAGSMFVYKGKLNAVLINYPNQLTIKQLFQ